jgi:hypothetical protein
MTYPTITFRFETRMRLSARGGTLIGGCLERGHDDLDLCGEANR